MNAIPAGHQLQIYRKKVHRLFLSDDRGQVVSLTDIVPSWPMTEDILLISIFGGLINALAISLCLLPMPPAGTNFIADLPVGKIQH